MSVLLVTIILIIAFILLISIRQINEYERGILYTLGKFTKILNPGWRIILPIINSYDKVDMRTKTVDVPEQEAITKDNVSIKIALPPRKLTLYPLASFKIISYLRAIFWIFKVKIAASLISSKHHS